MGKSALVRQFLDQLRYEAPDAVLLEEVVGTEGWTLAGSLARTICRFLWQRLRLRLRGYSFRLRHLDEVPAPLLRRRQVCMSVTYGLAMVDAVRGGEFQAHSHNDVSTAARLAILRGEPAQAAARAAWLLE